MNWTLPEHITPYYEEESVLLLCGDGFKMARHLPRVDMILIDPPYAETSYEWDRWQKGWPAAAIVALKPSGSMWCTGSFRMFWDNRDEFTREWMLAQDIIWEKHSGSSMFNDRFRRVHEMAVQFYPKTAAWADIYKNPVKVYNAEKRRVKRQTKPDHWSETGNANYMSESGGPLLMHSVIWARSMHHRTSVSLKGEKNGTQKPFDLLAPLIEYSCPPGGTVLDLTCGSGSTVALATRMGRKAIGIDIREGQCELARERLHGGPLFMEWAAENEPPLDAEQEAAIDEATASVIEHLAMPALPSMESAEQMGLFGFEEVTA